MFELKLYEEKDRELYLNTQKDAFEKYIIEFFGKFNPSVMQQHLKKLKSNLFKILIEKDIAGFVYFKEEEDRITVDVLCLFPEFRNSGLGSQVLRSFIEQANQLNKPIYLDTFKTNPAKRFYERHGFVVDGENHSHYVLKYEP